MTEPRPAATQSELEALSREVSALRREVAELRGQRASRRRVAFATFAILGIVAGTAGAQSLTAFSPGTPAVAADVNANFQTLKTWLEQKVGPVGTAVVTFNGSVNKISLTDDGDLEYVGATLGSDNGLKFTVEIKNTPGAITRSLQGGNGDLFNINEAGLYAISAGSTNDWQNCPTSAITVAKNTVGSTAPVWSSTNTLLVTQHYDNVSYSRIGASNLVNLAAGDVVRVFGNGSTNTAANCTAYRFEIKRVR